MSQQEIERSWWYQQQQLRWRRRRWQCIANRPKPEKEKCRQKTKQEERQRKFRCSLTHTHTQDLSSPQFCISFVSVSPIFRLILLLYAKQNRSTNQPKKLNLLFSGRKKNRCRENHTAWLSMAWTIKKWEVSIKKLNTKETKKERTHFRLFKKNKCELNIIKLFIFMCIFMCIYVCVCVSRRHK